MFPLPDPAERSRPGGTSATFPAQSCSYCFKTPAEQMALTIAQRHEAIRRVTTPLPGSQPCEN